MTSPVKDDNKTETGLPERKRRIRPVTAAVYAAGAAALGFFVVHGTLVSRTGGGEDIHYSEAREAVLMVEETPASEAQTERVTETETETETSQTLPPPTETSFTTAAASVASGGTAVPQTSAEKKPRTTRTMVIVRVETHTETIIHEEIVSETETSASTAPPETTPETTVTTTTSVSSVVFPADINKLSREELQSVPGIGGKTADEIIALRQKLGAVRNLRQLLEINGIGESRLSQMSAYLYVSPDLYLDDSCFTTTTTAVTKRTTGKTAGGNNDPEPVQPFEPKSVHINSATAEEIEQALGISYDKAKAVTGLRDKIGYYSSIEELLLTDCLTASEIAAVKDYIIID